MNFLQGIQWKLVNQKFNTYALTVLFNAVPNDVHEDKIEDKKHRYFVKLTSAKNKTMYQSIKLFKTEQEARDYQIKANSDFNSFAKMMKNAEKIVI